MSGDYSKNRFDPRKHFTNVLMQQGRVQLDSDWNEMAEVFDRRFRAQQADTLGRFAVPRRTPDAFQVALTGKTLTIGTGRMYVDGLMPENHGDPAGKQAFDPVLHEPRGRGPIDYTKQPYFPSPPAIPLNSDGNIEPVLVYLDTWQREVTYVEDPDLVERAIGVDTATRTQTVWRVRLLEHPGLTDGAPNPEVFDSPNPPTYWATRARPATGRLTTGTENTAPKDVDPCLIPPSGGFRGLENQLYRVEIHTTGALGGSFFKWSRDNASVASQVTAINAATNALTVSNVGRDAVLRFNGGDWIELLDDLTEPDGEPNSVHGVMLLVLRVDDDARRIEIDPKTPIPGSFEGDTAALAARRTRVRRWDQRGSVKVGAETIDLSKPESGGLIPIPKDGSPVLLELGVTVRFSIADDGDPNPDPSPFRAGDYWTFSARTEGAHVEPLTEAPPRGHHHHYAPLAWVAPSRTVDLRSKWPEPLDNLGGNDCDLHVSADDHNREDQPFTIQDAINELRERGGGSICLGAGIFYITPDALRIDSIPPADDGSGGLPARGITIRGRGAQTVLIRQFTVPPSEEEEDEPPPEEFDLGRSGDLPSRAVLRITQAADVALSDMVVVSSASANHVAPAIAVRTVAGLTIERCFFLHTGILQQESPNDSAAIGLSGAIVRAAIRDCVFVSRRGIGLDGFDPLLLVDVDIERNVFSCRASGIALLNHDVVYGGRTSIAQNQLDCGELGVGVTGLVHPGGQVDIVDNTVDCAFNGIQVGATRALIRGNVVRGGVRRAAADPLSEIDPFFGVGIRLSSFNLIELCRIEGNRVVGFGMGIRCEARARDLQITDNHLDLIDTIGISNDFNPELFGSEAVVVERNVVRNVGVTLRSRQSVFGIALFGCIQLTIADNTLDRIGELPASLPGPSPSGFRVNGIFLQVCQQIDIRDNRIKDLGPKVLFDVRPEIPLPGEFPNPDCVAIHVRNHFGAVRVSGNRVFYRDLEQLGPPRSALVLVRPGRSPTPTGFIEPVFAIDGVIENAAAFSEKVVLVPKAPRQVQIIGNHLEAVHSSLGGGNRFVAQVTAEDLDLLFSNNVAHLHVVSVPQGGDSGDYLLANIAGARINEQAPAGSAVVVGNTFTRSFTFGAGSGARQVRVVLNTRVATAVANRVDGVVTSLHPTPTPGAHRIDLNV